MVGLLARSSKKSLEKLDVLRARAGKAIRKSLQLPVESESSLRKLLQGRR